MGLALVVLGTFGILFVFAEKLVTSIILLIGVLITILFSCGTNAEDPADPADVNIVRTEAVATFASSLTETLVAVPSTSPTLTVEPTFTPEEGTATLESTPTANPCYNLFYIEDVTIPDNTQMKPGVGMYSARKC